MKSLNDALSGTKTNIQRRTKGIPIMAFLKLCSNTIWNKGKDIVATWNHNRFDRTSQVSWWNLAGLSGGAGNCASDFISARLK